MELTGKELLAILKKNEGQYCPYCGSDNIDAFSTTSTDYGHSEIVVCCFCQKKWVEHIKYKLFKVTNYKS